MRLITALLLALLPLVLAQDYYKLLGLDKSADDRDIKRAYRKLSKKFHPDKNPNDPSAHQKFVEIAEAYEALSDSDSRRIYDQHGAEGLQRHKSGGGGGHHDPFDLFSRFFGGSGHFGGGERGMQKGPNMEVRVDIPLADFYKGSEKEFSVEKQVVCEECDGSGSQDGHMDSCNECGGRGVRVVKHMLAPGIFQQVQTRCDRCSGKGQIIAHPCKVCHGNRVVRKTTTHTLSIEKGSPRGIRISFENEADESPEWIAGDLIVNVHEKTADGKIDEDEAHQHEDGIPDGTWFRRRGKDLFWKEVLSLREALLGDWTRNLTHLDGHEIQLGRKKGQTVQPGLVEAVKGEGMPIYRSEGMDEYGDLLVEYVVVLPDEMESGMRKDIAAVFEKWRKKNGVSLNQGKKGGNVEKDEL
ncbi:hypothetical protein DFP73DRAFT_490942 [Morchella snyderi]|nr:hypothetical protein DFP73DRAFT_490942 [Morchella snyderi]